MSKNVLKEGKTAQNTWFVKNEEKIERNSEILHELQHDLENRHVTEPKHSTKVQAATKSLSHLISLAAETLPDLNSDHFGKLFDRYGSKKVVLLGEASHGTSEFYQARAAISKRLIEEHGFNIVAIEGDWPDGHSVDRYVRHRSVGNTEKPFKRFPSWMWKNTDAQAFIKWLHRHNSKLDFEKKVGFYGLDMYSMRESIGQVLNYLKRVDPEAARVARDRYNCLSPWLREPAEYGAATLVGLKKCEPGVLEQLNDLLKNRVEYAKNDGLSFFDAHMNARVVESAEKYYRVMYYGDAESWNLRDTHMFETLQSLMKNVPNGKAIVWAHNSHIGDARATEMGSERGELNIGQLCRQAYGDEAALIGFGTHTGTVTAASKWDSPAQTMRVIPSRPDSYERLCHDADKRRFLLDLHKNEHLRKQLMKPLLERFIGVIYRPNTERWSHYTECVLPSQFDAYVWFDETKAVTPLRKEHLHEGEPETYPFGL
ncbi:unnamed protein product, partial [Mesorhabditis belari]|uniref:Erythromycin esterase n=1 Tax=Mesorhabditis belari TaxID=2138241 RepID=A0AAF3JB29_9BILA